MSEIARLEGTAAGRSFIVEIGGGMGPRCVVSDAAWAPLAEALCLAWTYGPKGFVELVETGCGVDLEGDSGWTYSDDAPDEIPAGSVLAYAGKGKIVVARRDLEVFASALGLALIELGAGPAELSARLRALAAKGAA